MVMELCCGPIGKAEVQQEIPFLCALVRGGGSQQIGVMYGLACRAEDGALWTESKIEAPLLDEWIADSIRRGIYSPGECDLFIFDGERLTVQLCHESDIHVETTEVQIIRDCTARWLERRFRVVSKPLSTGNDWKEVGCIEDVVSGAGSHD